MFNTLTPTQQQVNTIIEAIGDTDNEMLTTHAGNTYTFGDVEQV